MFYTKYKNSIYVFHKCYIYEKISGFFFNEMNMHGYQINERPMLCEKYCLSCFALSSVTVAEIIHEYHTNFNSKYFYYSHLLIFLCLKNKMSDFIIFEHTISICK